MLSEKEIAPICETSASAREAGGAGASRPAPPSALRPLPSSGWVGPLPPPSPLSASTGISPTACCPCTPCLSQAPTPRPIAVTSCGRLCLLTDVLPPDRSRRSTGRHALDPMAPASPSAGLSVAALPQGRFPGREADLGDVRELGVACGVRPKWRSRSASHGAAVVSRSSSGERDSKSPLPPSSASAASLTPETEPTPSSRAASRRHNREHSRGGREASLKLTSRREAEAATASIKASLPEDSQSSCEAHRTARCTSREETRTSSASGPYPPGPRWSRLTLSLSTINSSRRGVAPSSSSAMRPSGHAAIDFLIVTAWKSACARLESS
mmetsp:Transcript_17136/g.55936  ORF Transcript_17136/g.55936 Transcript_17136/m.55936 type:complete len:327 (+) Transcript_17136:562-1542(+)